MRSAGLIEAGNSRLDWSPGAGARAGAGFRPIEPVTSGSLIAVAGSKNDEPLLMELVVSGSGGLGAGNVPSGAGIGRLGLADGAVFGAVTAGLWD